MIKRTIEVSEPCYLYIQHRQLRIEKAGDLVGSVPIEDLGVLILENSGVVITQSVIISCQKHNVAVLFCDEKHLPVSLALPLVDGHTLQSKYLQSQIAVGKPKRNASGKRLLYRKSETKY